MNFDYSETQGQIRAAVRELCKGFGPECWQQCAQDGAYPEAFVDAVGKAGWLAALIPEEYGGAGLPLLDACLILQEINPNGGSAVHCHAQMYKMASIMPHGSEAQKPRTLPRIAAGSVRLQAFGVAEPDAGSATLAIKTFASKVPGGYVVNGQKIWTSRYSLAHVPADRAHDAYRRREEEDRGLEPLPDRHRQGRGVAESDTDPHDDQPPHLSSLHRRPAPGRGRPHRGRARRGIMPGAGDIQNLVPAVGGQRAKQLLLTARRIPAEPASAWGMVTALAEPGHALAAAVAEACEVALAAPMSVHYAKLAASRGGQVDLHTGYALDIAADNVLASPEDRLEGVRAFNEKRAPRWSGR